MKNKKIVSYSVGEGTIKQLKELSEEKQLSMSVIIQLAVNEYYIKMKGEIKNAD